MNIKTDTAMNIKTDTAMKINTTIKKVANDQ
jgi:hypothetical protein